MIDTTLYKHIDKVEHWAFGFVLSLFGLFYAPLFFLGIVFALGKELYDWKVQGHFSIGDVLATVWGFYCAVIFSELMV
jgi:hypothetical protein